MVVCCGRTRSREDKAEAAEHDTPRNRRHTEAVHEGLQRVGSHRLASRRESQPVSCQAVDLDRLESRERHVRRFERYGNLLTEHQRQVLDLYLCRDWSLSEIARWQKTSRAAVHDLIRRSTDSLDEYESRLGLVAGAERREALATQLRREVASLSRRLERLESRLARMRA
jgi:predicted DNA-binding protein YlxM (UPF0122 family)